MAQKQIYIKASPENWTSHNSKVTFNGNTIHLTNKGRGSALLWLNTMDFRNGSVELDIKGSDERGNSFLGLAFHGLDNDTYDAVYFRPFNFKVNDPVKNDRSVQYISPPDHFWHSLRKKSPGKYEGRVTQVPNPNDWFHVRVTINFPETMVYVNGHKDPVLRVEQLSNRKHGNLGLWIDSDLGRFRNIKVIKED